MWDPSYGLLVSWNIVETTITIVHWHKSCLYGLLSPYTLALFGWLAPSQPAVLFSHTNSAPASSHQSTSSIFLSQQISVSHRPPASWYRSLWVLWARHWSCALGKLFQLIDVSRDHWCPVLSGQVASRSSISFLAFLRGSPDSPSNFTMKKKIFRHIKISVNV
jgi:hypothetical protein